MDAPCSTLLVEILEPTLENNQYLYISKKCNILLICKIVLEGSTKIKKKKIRLIYIFVLDFFWKGMFKEPH